MSKKYEEDKNIKNENGFNDKIVFIAKIRTRKTNLRKLFFLKRGNCSDTK